MEKLGGLIRVMPQTCTLFLVGGMAIGGLPPFNGFVSEFILYSGILVAIRSVGISHITLMLTSLASLAFIGSLSMLTFTKGFGTIFLGSPRTQLQHAPREVGIIMRLPQYLILIGMLSIGLFPQLYFSIIQKIVKSSASITITKDLALPASLTSELSGIGKFSLILLVLPVLIYLVRKGLTRKVSSKAEPTWGCGYQVPSEKMQYTGKSFSKSLGKLLNFIVLEKKKYKEIQANEIFPAARRHSSHYNDFFETKIFNGIIGRLLYSLNYFQFIQNGKIQAYILYGIFFIMLIFLGTFLKLI
jgi:NADH:ubiquinone oxidoreductase subunit 5 (subunit L)/multisubunit Na+/H+ antiporter MnhA subunit